MLNEIYFPNTTCMLQKCANATLTNAYQTAFYLLFISSCAVLFSRNLPIAIIGK